MKNYYQDVEGDIIVGYSCDPRDENTQDENGDGGSQDENTDLVGSRPDDR